MKQSEKCIVSQTGYEPKWFFPSVGDQMVSEITVAKGPKLALLHCEKSESDENGKNHNQIPAKQMGGGWQLLDQAID